jgi:hypothetical protein
MVPDKMLAARGVPVVPNFRKSPMTLFRLLTFSVVALLATPALPEEPDAGKAPAAKVSVHQNN